MDQAARDLANGIHPVRLTKLILGVFSIADVAHRGDEQAVPADTHFAHRQLQGKGGAVLAAPDHFACAKLGATASFMLGSVLIAYQEVDVAADDFLIHVAEHPLGGRVARLHQTPLVDGDHAFDDAVQNTARELLAGRQLPRVPRALVPQGALPREVRSC